MLSVAMLQCCRRVSTARELQSAFLVSSKCYTTTRIVDEHDRHCSRFECFELCPHCAAVIVRVERSRINRLVGVKFDW